jgi:hypothetical protein
MSFELCQAILLEEAVAQHLDAELVRIFFAEQCYKA